MTPDSNRVRYRRTALKGAGEYCPMPDLFNGRLVRFTEALELWLVEDQPIRRIEWRRKLLLKDGTIVEVWPSGTETSWQPTVADVLADDWVLVSGCW